MFESTLSTLSKIILGIILLVAVGGVVTAAVAVSAEKDLNKAKSVKYEAASMNSKRASMTEGAYWELQDIVTMVDSVETGRYTLITDIMANLPNYGNASYYYSFTENAVLSFFPLDDPEYAINLWQNNITNEYAILQDVVPILRNNYQEYKKDKTKWADRFKDLCSSLGVPFPSVAVSGYDWFEYQGLGTSMPSSSKLTIAYLDADKMDLIYDDCAVLHYNRIKALPQEIAPVTLYFQEKAFFFSNYDKLVESKWKISEEEIDAHFRKTFKSKKY
jgi:hypothetical protein